MNASDITDPADLAAEINREHDAAHTKVREGVEHARRCGERLLQAKAKVGHGGWLPWLKAHVRFPERTAQAYMRLASRWDELQAKSATAVADLTLRDALAALLDRPKPPPQAPAGDDEVRQAPAAAHDDQVDQLDPRDQPDHPPDQPSDQRDQCDEPGNPPSAAAPSPGPAEVNRDEDQTVRREYTASTACGMPLPNLRLTDAELSKIGSAARRDERKGTKARARRMHEKLKQKYEKKVERAIQIEIASLRKSNEEAMRKRLAESAAQLQKHLSKRIDLPGFMAEDEYHLIIDCLDPDRAPEDRRGRFAEAFSIMKRVGVDFE